MTATIRMVSDDPSFDGIAEENLSILTLQSFVDRS